MKETAQSKYDKQNTKMYCFKFNKKTDKDIIELLDKQTNRQNFIKNILRNYDKSIDNK